MLELIVTAFVLGVSLGALSLFIDNMMDKGHLFDFVRLWAFKRHGGSITEVDYDSFHDRINHYNNQYWALAMKDKGFMNWVCPLCIAGKVGSIGSVLFFVSCYDFQLIELMIFTFVATPICYLTAKLF